MAEVCHVCGKPLDEIYSVSCMVCGRKIHFPSAETADKGCGHIVTQWYACALSFECNRCSEQKQFRKIEKGKLS